MSRSTRLSFTLMFPLLLLATSAVQAQNLQRLVAEFRFGAEQSTSITAAPLPLGPDGAPIYQKSFFLPADQATVFITLSSTGDAHEGAALWFSARVNGRFCNPGNDGAGFAPPGWVPLQKHFNYDSTYNGGMSGGDGGGGNSDMHDNGIYYTWCCPKDILDPGGFNRAEIRLATGAAGQTVFVERSHYYIDSVNTKLCNQADPIDKPGDPTDPDAVKDAMALEDNKVNNVKH